MILYEFVDFLVLFEKMPTAFLKFLILILLVVTFCGELEKPLKMLIFKVETQKRAKSMTHKIKENPTIVLETRD